MVRTVTFLLALSLGVLLGVFWTIDHQHRHAQRPVGIVSPGGPAVACRRDGRIVTSGC